MALIQKIGKIESIAIDKIILEHMNTGCSEILFIIVFMDELSLQMFSNGTTIVQK